MLLTGPSFKRYALRLKEEDLATLFIQSELGIWKAILERSDDFEYLGGGLSYLDLMNDSGDELDSKSSSVPDLDSNQNILIIQERGKLFELNISETGGIYVELNSAGLIHKADYGNENVAIEFIPRDSPEYSCKILQNGAFVDSKFVKETYAHFIEYINNPDNGATFKSIQNSSYYEDDHSLGGEIHNILLSYRHADFSVGALEYFSHQELITLSQNDSLSDSLTVGLFKRALSLINSGDGPHDEWSEEEKEHSRAGEKIRNFLLGNNSMYMNRHNVYADTDIIGWFIEKNLNASTKPAILRNENLGLNYLEKIAAKYNYRDSMITRHPAWVKAKMEEVHKSMSESFSTTLYAGNGVTENVEVVYKGERYQGTRIWRSGEFTQSTGKKQLLEYYQCLLNSSAFTHENILVNGDFELERVSDGYWEDDSINELYQNGDVEDFEYLFDVTDLDFSAIPVLVKVDVTLSYPTKEIEIYGNVIEELFHDLTDDALSSGFILLASPNGFSLIEGLDSTNEKPSFLVNYIDKLYSNAMNWFIEEFELAGETILQGMELELSIEGFDSFNINIGELKNKLEES